MSARFATPADDALLTSIAMHPDVRRWTAHDGAPDFNPTSYTAHPRSKAIVVEGGFFALPCLEDRAYAVHTQFLPDVRCSDKVRRALEAQAFMFLNCDAELLVTMVPDNNPQALWFAHAMGFRDTYRRAGAWKSGGEVFGVQYLSLEIEDWILRHEPLRILGEEFHAQLGQPNHGHDPVHDSFVGAACALMAAGQVDKAVRIYGRWARATGYQPFVVLDDGVDIGTHVIRADGDGFKFEEKAHA
jgi:hypothetical protein